jgi:hypothetical protein
LEKKYEEKERIKIGVNIRHDERCKNNCVMGDAMMP